jgi:hypothetical protein
MTLRITVEPSGTREPGPGDWSTTPAVLEQCGPDGAPTRPNAFNSFSAAANDSFLTFGTVTLATVGGVVGGAVAFVVGLVVRGVVGVVCGGAVWGGAVWGGAVVAGVPGVTGAIVGVTGLAVVEVVGNVDAPVLTSRTIRSFSDQRTPALGSTLMTCPVATVLLGPWISLTLVNPAFFNSWAARAAVSPTIPGGTTWDP